MCIHDKDDLKEAQNLYRNTKIAVVVLKGNNGSIYGTTISVRDEREIQSTLADLRKWHSDVEGHWDFSDLNRKRIKLGLRPIVEEEPPKNYVPVQGFESNGLSFPQLIDELNSYHKRRSAAMV